MKIGLYTPFKPIIGGGEKYLLSIAEVLSIHNNVELLSPFNYDLDYFSERLGLNLNRVTFRRFTRKIPIYLPIITKQFDFFFCLTNHLTPPLFSLGKKSLLIVQFPFPYPETNIKNKFLKKLTYLKLNSYDAIVCYSKYVKIHINESIHKYKPVIILPPCINYEKFNCKDTPKENIILSVGRFFQKDHQKKFSQLIEAFKKLKFNSNRWDYHIAGFLDKENKKYFNELKKEIRGWPIFLHRNINFNNLVMLYHKSKIFWHATGLSSNEKVNPEKSEHFGLSVVEAMAAENVPIVANKGALPEIVEEGKSGYLFETIEDLLTLTDKVVRNENQRRILSLHATETAKKYDKVIFKRKLENLISLI